MNGYTLHATQRMRQRAVDEGEIARSLCGDLRRQEGALQTWYAAGVEVVYDTYLEQVITVYRVVRDEPRRRRRRGRRR